MTRQFFPFLCLAFLWGAGAILSPRPARAADGVVLKAMLTETGLPNAWVKGVFHDGDRLVVTHPAGTAVWDAGEGKFVPYAPGGGFRGVSVTGIAVFGGKTYVATESALNIREGGKWTALDRFQQVLHNHERLYADGKALYALAQVMYGGVLRYDGTKWEIVSRGSGTGLMNNATSILARGDEVFIGTTTNGLYHFDGKAWNVIGTDQGLPGVWVTSLAETPEGVWIGCFNGLALFADGKIARFGKGDGLPGNKISALKAVKEKLVIGTMDAGLSIKSRNVFVNVTVEKGLTDNRIEAIEAADEGVWVGTVNGLNLVEVR